MFTVHFVVVWYLTMSLKDIYGKEAEQSKAEKLPTLRQYLKLKGKATIPKRFILLFIWTPGKFPNYTLQTEHFRFQIDKNHPMYPLMPAIVEEMIESEKTIFLEVTDKANAKVKFHECNENGGWENVGENGLKFVQI